MPRALQFALPAALACVAGCALPVSNGPLAAFPDEFQGFWATDIYAQCPNHALVGQSEEAPIAINTTQIIGLENTCTVLQAVRGGEGIITAQLSCQGEGVTEEVTASLYRSGRALTFNRGEGSVLWSRCPVMLRDEVTETTPEVGATDVSEGATSEGGSAIDAAQEVSVEDAAAEILGIADAAEAAE